MTLISFIISKKSCKYFEEAIKTNPKYIDAYYNIGLA